MNENFLSLYNLLRSLWCHITFRRRFQLLLLVFLILFASVAEIFSIGSILPFLTVLMNPEKISEFKFLDFFLIFPNNKTLSLTLIFTFSVLIAGFIRVVLIWFQIRLSYSIGADISTSIFKKSIFQPFNAHLTRNSSEIISGVRVKTDNVIGSIIMPITNIFSVIVIISSILSVLFFVNSKIAISLFLGFAIIYYLVARTTKNQLAKDSRIRNYESSRVIKILQEGMGGIRDVILDGSQFVLTNLYQKSDWRLRRSEANVQILSSCPRYIIEAIGLLIIAFLAYFLSRKLNGLESALPILGTMGLGAQRLLPLLQQAYSSVTYIRGAKNSLADVVNLLNQVDYCSMHRAENKISFNKNIELLNVSFRYKSNGPLIINDMNLKIEKGTCIGIMGTSGSGKSTTLDLIMGLIYPSKGSLLVDGLVIDDLNCKGWYKNIAHVPQEVFLSDQSIAENIAFGSTKTDIDFELVDYAINKSSLRSFVDGLENGYLSDVGERGVKISGGQRQRIGIARALYKSAEIIVLDEATSALDKETENEIIETITNNDLNLTVIMVAHRRSSLRNCSKIFEIKSGKISRITTFEAMNDC